MCQVLCTESFNLESTAQGLTASIFSGKIGDPAESVTFTLDLHMEFQPHIAQMSEVLVPGLSIRLGLLPSCKADSNVKDFDADEHSIKPQDRVA